jgi:hypothetical protein
LRRASVVADGARRGLRVELVRVVEHGRLGGACCRAIVVACDGVQELREDGGIEISRSLFDHPQPKMDVAEEAALLGGSERRRRPELADPPDVVDEGRGEHEILSEPRMELRGFATQRRDADGVLEETSRVAVVSAVTGRRE